MKHIFITFFITIGLSSVKSQTSDYSNQIENRYSFVFFDLFHSKSASNGKFFSYQLASDISYLRGLKLNDQLKIKYGAGYTFYYLLDWNFDSVSGEESKDYFSMINFKGGIEWSNKSKIISSAILFNNYFLLNKILHHQGLSRRYFVTVEPEIRINLTDRFSISLFSPIGILPPFRGEYGYLSSNGFTRSTLWVDVNGLGVGLSYSW